MRSLLAFALSLLLTAPLAAQEESENANPWLDTPAPELRKRLSGREPVFEEKWYQVEVLIFARKNPVSREYWRLDQQPSFSPNPVYLAHLPRPGNLDPDAYLSDPGDTESALLPREAGDIDRAAAQHNAWIPLDQEQREEKVMAAMRERMENRGDFRILFHQAWRQPIRKRGHAFAVHVEGGERLQPLAPPLLLPPLDDADGEATSTTPEEPPSGDRQVSRPGHHDTAAEAEDPLSPREQGFAEMRGELKLYLGRYLHVAPNLWFTDESAADERFHVVIEQARRMRSEELHYLDHPLFGALLYIQPWKTPEQEEAALMEEALEAHKEREDD